MSKVILIGKYTFIEIYKSKIMMNIFFVGLFIMGISALLSELTYGVPSKISLDLGLGVMSIVSVFMALFIGSRLIKKEIEQRTLYMVLSRPVTRFHFLCGKILGISCVLFLNILILGLMSTIVYFLLGGSFETLILWCIFFTYIEGLIILLLVILFSLLTNSIMAIFYTFSIYFIGHTLGGLFDTLYVKDRPLLGSLLEVIKNLVPDFSRLNLKNFLLYKQDLSTSYLWQTSLYGVTYILLLLLLCYIAFRNKELD